MKTAKIKYLGGLSTEAIHIRSGKSILTDAPVDNNGKGEAFSPTDLAATSLGCCAITVMGIAAQKEGHEFKNSEIEITKIITSETLRPQLYMVSIIALFLVPCGELRSIKDSIDSIS